MGNRTPGAAAGAPLRKVGRGRDWWSGAGVGLLLAGVYLLSTGGAPFISDGEVMLITVHRIVDLRTVTLAYEDATFPQTIRRPDGQVFSRYGLGQPLAAAPFYALGRYVLGQRLMRAPDPYAIGRFCALLLPAFATALTAALVTVWAARLYRSSRVAVGLGILYGIGTLAWPYSRFFFSEPLFTACLMLAAVALYCRRPVLAGGALGYAVATRVGGAILLPVYCGYAWCRGGRVATLVRLAAGTLPGAALVLAHNWLRFRAFTEQGYAGEAFSGNLLVGLYGLLLSPGKSLFLYSPVLLGLVSAGVPFARRFPAEAALAGGLAAATLVQSALWWAWWAGWGWGPRFLVPLLPFLVLPLGTLLERRTARHLVFLILLPLSVAANLLGILVDFTDYLSDLGVDEARAYYDPAASPLLAHLRRVDLRHIPIVSLALDQSPVNMPQPWAILSAGVFVALVGVGTVLLWRTVRCVDAVPLEQATRR